MLITYIVITIIIKTALLQVLQVYLERRETCSKRYFKQKLQNFKNNHDYKQWY